MTTTTEPTTAPEAEPETPEATEPKERAKARTDITYFHDGRPMPGSHKHKLSTLAYFHSGGIVDGFPKRIPTKVFVAELAKLGIDKPSEPGWIVTLPNGITVECRADGEASEYDGPAPTRKASTKAPAAKKATTPRNQSKKAPAKKKPAKATARVRKETAKARATKATKKAPATRQVTPLPKGTPAPRRPSRAN